MIESDKAIYFENDIGTSQGIREIVLKENLVLILVPITSTSIFDPTID